MAYFRYEVQGGEFVVQGDRDWYITFNGIRIGGIYPCADDAIEAIHRARESQVLGPNLRDVDNPPADLTRWQKRLAD